MSSHHSTLRRRRATVPVVAMLGAAGLVLSACSSGKATADDPTYPTGQTITVTLIAPSPAQKAANDYLKATFEDEFPGNKLVFADETWADYQDDYQKELIDGKGKIPDVVEMGNTQTPGFTATGALLDLTDKYEDLGGADLLPGFVEIGSYDGRFYAPPYYSAGRVVMASSEIVSETVPETLAEYVAAGVEVKKSKKNDKLSGIYLPGQDWYDAMPYVWENGGYIAKQQSDGSWKAGFSSPGGIVGLVQVQNVMRQANSQKVGPANATEEKGAEIFCKGKIGYFSGQTWQAAQIQSSPKDGGCANTVGDPQKFVAFTLPGKEKGSVAATFAGGSNLGVAAKSKNPELAYQVLKIMTSPGYQDLMALNDFIPARISSSANLPQDALTLASARAAQNAILTPASPKWATVEAKKYLQNAFAEIAAGGNVPTVAKKLDKEIEDTLNSK